MARSSLLRQVEIALWVIGLSLIGFSSGATYARWSYQAQQERALFQGGPAVPAGNASQEPSLQAGLAPADLPQPAEEPQADAAPASAVPRVSDAPSSARPSAPNPVAGAFGRIEIPRLGLSAIVQEGADDATLARAVGLVPESSRPGQNGNVVLAGHRDTFFRRLRNIRENDRIRLVVPPYTYEYEVQSTRIVEPEETSVLHSKGVEELTLVTCYPFRFVGPAPERFIVSAARVN